MTDSFAYSRKRSELGKSTNFTDSKLIKVAHLPDPSGKFLNLDQHSERNSNSISIGNFPQMSVDMVNTNRVSTSDKVILHLEGGWPKEVDTTDPNETKKYIKKKLEKNSDNTDKFANAVKKLIDGVEDIFKINNEIDMFEEYFVGEEPEIGIETLKVKTLKLFRKNTLPTTSVSSISWHPEGSHKFACSYSPLRFQQKFNIIAEAAVWDVNSPNDPSETMIPPFPISKIVYNHKNPDNLGFGCSNGIIGIWDLKLNRHRPALLYPAEVCHHESVVDLIWLSSKSGNEFVTCSTDGYIKWWDTRQLEGPIDNLKLAESVTVSNTDLVLGATSIEYVADYGPKYLIGTESGAILQATKKPKKSAEINYANCYGLDGFGRHMGPTIRILRNPFYSRYFLSIGDWSVKIWEDDLKTPIINSKYHHSFLTDGVWSPARPGVFLAARQDGWLEVWDLFYSQNEASLSFRVSSSPLTCLKLNTVTSLTQTGIMQTDTGKFCTVGDAEGTVTFLKLCKSLYNVQPNEKTEIIDIFERGKAREETFKKQRTEKNKLQKDRDKNEKIKVKETPFKQQDLIKIEKEFNSIVSIKKTELQDLFGENIINQEIQNFSEKSPENTNLKGEKKSYAKKSKNNSSNENSDNKVNFKASLKNEND